MCNASSDDREDFIADELQMRNEELNARWSYTVQANKQLGRKLKGCFDLVAFFFERLLMF